MKMSKTLLVFLHGSGGTGPEIRSFLNSVRLEKYAMQTFQSLAKARNMDYVCPTANSRRYTPAMGERMNVWFDRGVDFQRKGLNDLEDIEGANKSVEQIIGILDTAKASYENIFVGGFSQGGCLSLHMIRSELVTKLPEQLKGIFSMGSFLVSKSVVLQEERMISKKGNMLLDIPIFMMHGDMDSMIRVQWGESTASSLLLKNRDVQYKSYPSLDHEIGQEELGDLLEWIDGILAVKKNNGENKEGKEVEKEAEREESLNQSSGHTVAATAGRDNIPGILYSNTVKGIKDTGESNQHPYVPYTLSSSYVTDSTGQPGQNAVTVITYEIPSTMVHLAAARPILACGGSFELEVRDPPSIRSDEGATTTANTMIQVRVSSSDPDHTAKEIGRRLWVRLSSDGASLNACPMS